MIWLADFRMLLKGHFFWAPDLMGKGCLGRADQPFCDLVCIETVGHEAFSVLPACAMTLEAVFWLCIHHVFSDTK
jgi:hypothetical protein